mmetsp:Transcript_22061/g.71004  ORF Transcript_22061/g.71004 Transcript_22061/m.71004 type:complete len:522 (-) Transcript_22061:2236-3801(-)
MSVASRAISRFNFNDLFVFEMANNHQGSVEHGLRIIAEMGAVAREAGIRAAIKFQFRQIDTFVHPDALAHADSNRHVQRFLSTRLSHDEFRAMADAARREGLMAMCTPFDEESVALIVDMDMDIIKIGSCSALDFPLLETVALAPKPVILSTGGLTCDEIDRVVTFLENRNVDFALMHCVSVYPTPHEHLQLSQISRLKQRYPQHTVGFSTHEDPDNMDAIKLAVALGAQVFEKHVGVPTESITLNKYSANPEQVRAWVAAYKSARAALGRGSWDDMDRSKESGEILKLQRGVFAREALPRGAVLTRENTYFAFPVSTEGQLTSGRFHEGAVLEADVAKDGAILASAANRMDSDKVQRRALIYKYARRVRIMLQQGGIPVGHDFHVELSHHRGLDAFEQYGCTLVSLFNREYAMKIVVQLAGQVNPFHFHKVKDETFYVVRGQLKVYLDDGHEKLLSPGDHLWVPRGVGHAFGTETGCIFIEVSSAVVDGDSYYHDVEINKLPRQARKTVLRNWGRNQSFE